MKNLLLLTITLNSIIFGKTIEPKIMHAQDYHEPEANKNIDTYSESSESHHHSKDILSTTIETSVQISIGVSSQITSEGASNVARMSFLNKNRIKIIEEIAQGEGEYLTTLLNIMKIKSNSTTIKILQDNFNQLIYLSHENFLKKLNSLV